MPKIKNFDLLRSPLKGTILIEASAGTGKTYTISGLFLRLILEKSLSVNEILVVTFTRAATGELRDRIRNNLREALEAFSLGCSDDEFFNALINKYKNREEILKRVNEALRDFDEASVFTIHGFCQKILRENAFECGSFFDTELISDQGPLIQEIIEDFWREHFYKGTPLFVHYAINKYSPETFLRLARKFSAQPFFRIIPQGDFSETHGLEKEFKEIFVQTRHTWKTSKDEIEKLLTTHGGLNRKSYSINTIEYLINCLGHYLRSDGNNPILFDKFEMLTKTGIEKATKKNHEPPSHQFFELCEKLKQKQEALCRIFDQNILRLKRTLFDYLQEELSKRKQRQNLQSFDDLLTKFREALEGKGGEAVAKALRAKYRAALIDEFQDTDPVQYAIFTNVFRNANQNLFLIGDPKQAIYSFRGADVFAYLEATGQVDSRYTLKENRRSTPDLITAINTVFSKRTPPFVFGEISFKPAAAAKTPLQEPLRVKNKSGPPLQCWFLDASTLDSGMVTGKQKFIKKSAAAGIIMRALGTEIAHILSLGEQNKALIGKRPIKEGDIAVLVRTNREAAFVQQGLVEFNIPTVIYSTSNLFDSYEAVEMERVLWGIAEPDNEKLLKAALATDIFGFSGEKIENLMEDEIEWERWLNKFNQYHEMWSERNFIRMFRYLISKEDVRTRLLSFSDGERRLTNLLHLSEVLHQVAMEKKLGVTSLLKWLSEQRNPDLPRLEEHQLRLESDEYAVKVVTIHKSKGLEYPIIFCPFLWAGSKLRNSKDHFIFHDEENNRKLTLDLGSEGHGGHRRLAEREILAENLRLLYVALTRAKNRCYIVWGRFNGAGTAAMTYLLHQQREMRKEDIVDIMESSFKKLSDNDIVESLKKLEQDSAGTICVQQMPWGEEKVYFPAKRIEEELCYRKFSRNIDRGWKIASFTSLVADQKYEEQPPYSSAMDLPDYDEESWGEKIVEDKLTGIFAFPRGAKAGRFMHDIFEHLDFSEKDTSLRKKLVTEKLREYGFELTWQETIYEMIQKVLSVPLHPGRKDFTLSVIDEKDKVNELEFYFPLQPISREKLKRIFLEYGGLKLSEGFPGLIEKLHFLPFRGFMKGFIDLVFRFEEDFYLVDWKSNFLGSKVDDYGPEELTEVMNKKFYILQYHLYTVAFNQYLIRRLPGYSYKKHFGGIYYIFLRGIDPEKSPEFGIYRAKPSEELIDELSRNLISSPNAW